jgi:hypothetical protein
MLKNSSKYESQNLAGERSELPANRAGTRRLAFNKFGLTEDPRGGHCVFEWQGRELLGEVKDVILFQGYANRIALDVRFMNGEPWPIQPNARLVWMLEREAANA